MDNDQVESGAMAPMETPETEAGTIIAAMSDDAFVQRVKRAAENAPIVQAAMRKLIVSISYPGDWTNHDGTACLSSAGAERYLKFFPLSFTDFQFKRENWEDDIGKAFRYIYTALAHMEGRSVQTQGIYSSRAPLHGKTQEGYRPIEEIDPIHIQSAARHICIGNGIKTLLGLRGIPTDELKNIFSDLGKNPDYVQDVTYRKGSRGGKQTANGASPKEDTKLRTEAMTLLTEMCNGNPQSIKNAIITFSKFEGSDGNDVYRDSVDKLSGKWLNKTYNNVKAAYEDWKKNMDGKAK